MDVNLEAHKLKTKFIRPRFTFMENLDRILAHAIKNGEISHLKIISIIDNNDDKLDELNGMRYLGMGVDDNYDFIGEAINHLIAEEFLIYMGKKEFDGLNSAYYRITPKGYIKYASGGYSFETEFSFKLKKFNLIYWRIALFLSGLAILISIISLAKK
mgnify:CR=1 FL=1